MFNLTQYIKDLWNKYKNLKEEEKYGDGQCYYRRCYKIIDWDEVAMIITMKNPFAAYLGMSEDIENTCAVIYCDETLIHNPSAKFIKGMTPVLILEMEEDVDNPNGNFSNGKIRAQGIECWSCACESKYVNCLEKWPKSCYQYLPKYLQERLQKQENEVG